MTICSFCCCLSCFVKSEDQCLQGVLTYVQSLIIIVIIAFKGAIRDFFYNLLTGPRTVSNTYTQVARAQSCADHVQHIERLSCASVMLRATWYEGTVQLLSFTELKSHLFEFYFIG